MSVSGSSDPNKLIVPSGLTTADGQAWDIVIEKKVKGVSVRLTEKEYNTEKIKELVKMSFDAVAKSYPSASPQNVTFTWTKEVGKPSETTATVSDVAEKVRGVAIKLIGKPLESEKGKALKHQTVHQSMTRLSKLLRPSSPKSVLKLQPLQPNDLAAAGPSSSAVTVSLSPTTQVLPVPKTFYQEVEESEFSEAVQYNLDSLEKSLREKLKQLLQQFRNKKDSVFKKSPKEIQAAFVEFGQAGQKTDEVCQFIKAVEKCILENLKDKIKKISFKNEAEKITAENKAVQQARELAFDCILNPLLYGTDLSDAAITFIRSRIEEQYSTFQPLALIVSLSP